MPMPIKRLAITFLSLAAATHCWSLRGGLGDAATSVLSLRGALALELLAAGAVMVFIAIRSVAKCERRIASVSIFTASLVLCLAAPALFLPVAAERAEWWAVMGSAPAARGVPFAVFSIWAISLLCAGLGMHFLVSLRWQRVSRAT